MYIVEKARQYAEDKHKGQFRKDRITPYFEHSEAVARMVEYYGGTPEMIAAAYLHDILEDTKTGIMELDKEFGFIITCLVMHLTDYTTEMGIKPRKNRREVYFLKLSFSSDKVKLIKLCDRIHNLITMDGFSSSFKKLYIKESEELYNHIKDRHKELAKILKINLLFLK